MIASRGFCLVLLGVAVTVGCGREPRGGPRVETYPITGTVLVDGEPAANLLVTCHPLGESKVYTNVGAYTNEEGEFSIGTYESGDGAPEGEYALTFLWGQWNMGGRYGPPDKLKGAYNEPETSEWTVVVEPGTPNDLGTIELTAANGK